VVGCTIGKTQMTRSNGIVTVRSLMSSAAEKKNEVLLLGQPMAWAPRQALLEQLTPDLKAAVDLATNPDLKAAVDLPTNTKQLSSV